VVPGDLRQERRGLARRLRYLAFYVAGGFAAAALQTATTLLAGTAADARVPVRGASGAIAAS
jgi:membrane associated rhomboid family serine protease